MSDNENTLPARADYEIGYGKPPAHTALRPAGPAIREAARRA